MQSNTIKLRLLRDRRSPALLFPPLGERARRNVPIGSGVRAEFFGSEAQIVSCVFSRQFPIGVRSRYLCFLRHLLLLSFFASLCFLAAIPHFASIAVGTFGTETEFFNCPTPANQRLTPGQLGHCPKRPALAHTSANFRKVTQPETRNSKPETQIAAL